MLPSIHLVHIHQHGNSTWFDDEHVELCVKSHKIFIT